MGRYAVQFVFPKPGRYVMAIDFVVPENNNLNAAAVIQNGTATFDVGRKNVFVSKYLELQVNLRLLPGLAHGIQQLSCHKSLWGRTAERSESPSLALWALCAHSELTSQCPMRTRIAPRRWQRLPCTLKM